MWQRVKEAAGMIAASVFLLAIVGVLSVASYIFWNTIPNLVFLIMGKERFITTLDVIVYTAGGVILLVGVTVLGGFIIIKKVKD